jgi:hypothetical protein
MTDQPRDAEHDDEPEEQPEPPAAPEPPAREIKTSDGISMGET